MDDVPEVVGEAQSSPGSSAALIRQVKKVTQRKYSAEDKIRIVLEGFRKEQPVSDLCRFHGLSPAVYYGWLKHFMEAGKARLKGDSLRDATSDEVKQLRQENGQLKELLGQTALELALFKKSLAG
jgi:transposase